MILHVSAGCEVVKYSSRKCATASAISFLSSPTLVPSFALLFLLYSVEGANRLILVVLCVVFASLVPIGMLYGLSKVGKISDFFVSAREQRASPFIGAISSYFIGGLLLFAIGAPVIVTSLMFCYGGNTFILMLITLRWKISVHASSIAAATIAFVSTFGLWAFALLITLIPVGWARVELKAHSPSQFMAAVLVTIVTTWLQLKVYVPLF